MVKEWEDQLRAVMNEQRAEQARIRNIQQDLWQAEEVRKEQFASEIEREDQLHKDIIDEFLKNIQARDMLEIVKREIFGRRGEIKSVFESISLLEEVGTKKVFYGNRVSDGESFYVDDIVHDYVPYFLSGLELYRLIPKIPQSLKEDVSLIFIGFLGKRNVAEQFMEGQELVKYNYFKFGLTYIHRQPFLHYIDRVVLARMVVISEFKRKDHQYLIEMSDISESELHKLIQSHSYQQQAQTLVQAGILDLARSGIFLEEG